MTQEQVGQSYKAMTPEHFLQLLTEAELHPQRLGPHYGIAFSVSLHVPTQFGTRYMAQWLCYKPDEFEKMTVEQAQAQIDACKKKLERVARTKSLSY
jgi:hypothetical protein